MKYLSKYYWEVFETVMEEDNDGDIFSPDLSVGPHLLYTGCKTGEYKAVNKLDRAGILSTELGTPEQMREFANDFCYMILPQERYTALCEAFRDGDRAAFDKIVADAEVEEPFKKEG